MLGLARSHPAQSASYNNQVVGTLSPSRWRAVPKIPFESIAYIFAAIDFLAVVLSGVASEIGYQAYLGNSFANTTGFAGIGIVAATLYVLQLRGLGLYSAQAMFDSRRPELKRLSTIWLCSSLVLTVVAFLLKIGAEFSRGSVICFAVGGLTLVLTLRISGKALVRRALNNGLIQGRRAIVIGERADLATIDARYLLRRLGMTQVASFILPNDKNDNLAMSANDMMALQQAAHFARTNEADEILLALPWSKSRRLELVRDWLRSIPLPVRLLPDQLVRSIISNPAFIVREESSVNMQRAPLSRGERAQKRLFDLIIASAMLLMLSPIMLLAAIAVRVDSPGPIIFRQRRRGFSGRQFVIYKFRTMTVQEDGDKIRQAAKHDPRVTAIGRWLRKSSVDELPQLLNVLLGNMSIVGPRPHALAHDDQFEKIIGEYAFRQHVKPGITGWAQCNGNRGATPRPSQVAERVRLDLWYINHWSLWLDFHILFKTAFEVLQARNSY